jgi:hypothetical protein
MHARWRLLILSWNCAIGIGYVCVWFLSIWQGYAWRADFTAFFTGWSMVRDGVRDGLYDFALQARYQQALIAPASFKDGLLPYVNPPHATLPFVWLAFVSLEQAYYLWAVVQFMLLGVVFWQVYRLTTAWTRYDFLLFCSTIVAFLPLMHTLLRGTFSLLMLVALLGLYQGLMAQRPVSVGAWLAVATIKPQVVVVPITMLLASRRWTFLGATGLLIGLPVLGSVLFFGFACWQGFLQALRTVEGYYGIFGIVPSSMYNFKGSLTLLLGDERGSLISALSNAAYGCVIIVTILLWRRPPEVATAQFQLRLALTLLLGLLFSPHLYSHDGLLFLVPLLITIDYLQQKPLRRSTTAWLAIVPTLIVISELTLGGSLGIRIPTVLMFGLAFWLMNEARSAHR